MSFVVDDEWLVLIWFIENKWRVGRFVLLEMQQLGLSKV